MLVSTTLVCWDLKLQRTNWGYPLAALHTVSLSYLSGTVAIKTSTTVILCAFIITFSITMLMALLAGKMVNMFFGKNKGHSKA